MSEAQGAPLPCPCGKETCFIHNPTGARRFGSRPLSEEGAPTKATDAERTVASIAAMLGWMNVPPRHVLEADVAALKARALRSGSGETTAAPATPTCNDCGKTITFARDGFTHCQRCTRLRDLDHWLTERNRELAWLDAKVQEGRGAICFGFDEGGAVGIWLGDGGPKFGVGRTAGDALKDAQRRTAPIGEEGNPPAPQSQEPTTAPSTGYWNAKGHGTSETGTPPQPNT